VLSGPPVLPAHRRWPAIDPALTSADAIVTAL
jgi:hypothetical protein